MERRNESGFSLIEFTISVAIMTVVLGGIFMLTANNQLIGRNESETSDMTQNARVAFDLMSREIRNAGLGFPSNQAVVSATSNSITVRGFFSKISTTALSVDPIGGVLVVGSAADFQPGQSLLLVDANSTAAAYTSIRPNGVDKITNRLTVSTAVTAITPGATISRFGPGTAVSVVERITYSIESGAISRTIAPELNPDAGDRSELANNILDASGNNGLSFTYFDSNNTQLSGVINPATVTLVKIKINARTKDKDAQTQKYRVFNLTTEAKPRG